MASSECSSQILEQISYGIYPNTALLEGKNWRQEMYKFLRQNQSKLHPSTKSPPFQVLFGRSLRDKTSEITDGNPLPQRMLNWMTNVGKPKQNNRLIGETKQKEDKLEIKS